MRTDGKPPTTGAAMLRTRPMSWKSGNQPTVVVVRGSATKASMAWRALATTLAWLIITPDGLRVEPEVYWR